MKSTSITVTATSAIEFTKGQVEIIEKAVKDKYKVSSVTIEKVVNPNVIGGVKLTINSVEYDGTVQGKLAAVKSQLMSQL